MKRILAAMLALVCLLSLAACSAGTQTPYAEKEQVTSLARAQKPETAQQPNWADYDEEEDWDAFEAAYVLWEADREERLTLADGWDDGISEFSVSMMKTLLTGLDGQNGVCSPVDLYMALSMLAECTDGESREQLLSLLGTESIEALRTRADTLWTSACFDDGQTRSSLGTSLWLREGIDYQPETVDTLARVYHASSFQGEMGSEAMNEALRGWLNEETGGLLEDAVQNVSLRPQTVLALASTLYFSACWEEKFYDGRTQAQVFHTPDGDVTCDFLHQNKVNAYYHGEKFEAARLRFRDGGAMWLVLPREGFTPEDLLADDETTRFLAAPKAWEDVEWPLLDLSLPKFDVSQSRSLIDALCALGVTDVFDAAKSDFSPLMPDTADGIAVTEATHAARVRIDEEGCEGAAFTLLAVTESAAFSPQERTLVFDRPFLFLVTADNEQPLFAGVVNRPDAG